VYKGIFVLLFRKGHELHRLLHLKTGTCAVNISETCQIVICLDLAASVIGVPFDKVCVITNITLRDLARKTILHQNISGEIVENIAAPQPHHAICVNKLADVTVIIVNAAVIEYTVKIEVNNM